MIMKNQMKKLVIIFLILSFVVTSLFVYSLKQNSRERENNEYSPVPTEYRFYKTELHHHSGYSDGRFDIGVISTIAKDIGYDALFLTDHDLFMPMFNIDDSVDHWKTWTYLKPDGVVYEKNKELTNEKFIKGIKSLHMMSNSSGYYGQGYYVNRAIIGNRGPVFLNFSIYPMNFSDKNSRFYISILIGGESYPGFGFTLDNGTVIRDAIIQLDFGINTYENITTSDYIRRTINLPYIYDEWNNYEINVTDFMLKSLPIKLAEYYVIHTTKIYCVSEDSLTNLFLDDFRLYNNNEKSVGELLSNRNIELLKFNTPNFKIFPSVEFTYFNHMNYFKYDFTSSEEYIKSDEIASSSQEVADWIHQQEKPYDLVHLNHPNYITINAEDVEAIIEKDAFGADVIEVRTSQDIIVWDKILNKRPIIGTWTTDNHEVLHNGAIATYIYSQNNSLENLLTNLYEGRVYLARNNFNVTIIFNFEKSNEPYPSRYIKQISSNKATLYLKINNIKPNWSLLWIQNGTTILTEKLSDPMLETMKTFTMTDESNYFRIELRNEHFDLIAMSEPIFFKTVS